MDATPPPAPITHRRIPAPYPPPIAHGRLGRSRQGNQEGDADAAASWPFRVSMVNIHDQREGYAYGSWIQDVHGSRQDALKRAMGTSAVNGGMPIALVEAVSSVTPMLDGPAWHKVLAIVGGPLEEPQGARDHRPAGA